MAFPQEFKLHLLLELDKDRRDLHTYLPLNLLFFFFFFFFGSNLMMVMKIHYAQNHINIILYDFDLFYIWGKKKKKDLYSVLN